MRIFRNKLFIGCVCILLAVLVGFVLDPFIEQAASGNHRCFADKAGHP